MSLHFHTMVKGNLVFCTEFEVFPHVKNCEFLRVYPTCKLACLLAIVSSVLAEDMRLLGQR